MNKKPQILKLRSLFDSSKDIDHEPPQINTNKTYRAIRHEIVRSKQGMNCSEVHHPREKIKQLSTVLGGKHKGGKILELSAGQGNLTDLYSEYGTVTSLDKKLGTGDSYRYFHKLIYEGKKYTIIDIDPYGFPNRFFPDIYLLIDNGVLFVTMPKPYVNILNGITQSHLIAYYGSSNPNVDQIIERIVLWGLCHWRKVQLLHKIDCKSIWRFVFSVEKVKATEYTGVNNR